MKKNFSNKNLLLGFILSLFIYNSTAQESFYDYVELGPYSIGFRDTLIFDHEINYQQYGYDGPAPLFLQIWFPSEEKLEGNKLGYWAYRDRDVAENLAPVYQQLLSSCDEIFVRDGIAFDLVEDESIDYGEAHVSEIKGQILGTVTNSTYARMPRNLNFPVIVYHHGSQGFSDENSIMAEYFASRGYVFISANFHLPYPEMAFGLLPYNLEVENKHNQSSAKKVLELARKIAKNQKVFYVGHSWGAQEGWCFLNEAAWADGFVSLETTIEFTNDTNKIKELWPYVYTAIKTEKKQVNIPTLLFADTQENKPFKFFENAGTNMMFASFKEPFAHNSYISFSMMRYFFRDQFPQPDEIIMKSQVTLYAEHLKLMHAFFEDVQKKTAFNKTLFKTHFYIN